MQAGGFSFSGGMNALIANQSQAQLFKTPERMVGTLSALSSGTSPEKAATTMDQFIRSTTGALIRARQPNVDGESIKQADYLKGLGVTDQMDPAEIGKKIADDVTRQQADDAKGIDPETGQAKKTNVYTYLGHHGYGNAADIDALMVWQQLEKSGVAKTFMDAAASPDGLTDAQRNDPNFRSADQRLAKFQSSEQADARRATLAEQMKDTYAAGPMERYASLQKIGFSSLVNKQKMYGKEAEWRDDFVFGGRQDIHKEVMDTAMEEAKRVGMPAGFGKYGRGFDYATGRAHYGEENTGLYDFPGVGSFDIASTGTKGTGDRAASLEKINAAITAAGGNLSQALLQKLADNSEKLLAATVRPDVDPLPLGRALDKRGNP
jgi:hypothetical protein